MRPFCGRRYAVLGPGGVQSTMDWGGGASTEEWHGFRKLIHRLMPGGMQDDMVESTTKLNDESKSVFISTLSGKALKATWTHLYPKATHAAGLRNINDVRKRLWRTSLHRGELWRCGWETASLVTLQRRRNVHKAIRHLNELQNQ